MGAMATLMMTRSSLEATCRPARARPLTQRWACVCAQAAHRARPKDVADGGLTPLERWYLASRQGLLGVLFVMANDVSEKRARAWGILVFHGLQASGTTIGSGALAHTPLHYSGSRGGPWGRPGAWGGPLPDTGWLCHDAIMLVPLAAGGPGNPRLWLFRLEPADSVPSDYYCSAQADTTPFPPR